MQFIYLRLHRFLTRVVSEKLSEVNGQKGIYSEFYDPIQTVFIHTPKTAGTSISKVLFDRDPWHYTARELAFINAKKFREYRKVAFVRNPLDRILSTYNYAKKWIEKNPGTSIAFLSHYENFEDFVLNGLSSSLVENHYFFWTYLKYTSRNFENNDIQIGCFESLEKDCYELLGIEKGQLPALNKSTGQNSYKDVYTQKMRGKVIDLYREDFETFNYDF